MSLDHIFGQCMRCDARSSETRDVVSNLPTFWRGTTFGHLLPTLCRECIEDVRRFTERRVTRKTHTEAEWELAQGEVHDLRTLLTAMEAGMANVIDGTWSAQMLIDWWRDAKPKHDKGLLQRFKNVMSRYAR